MKAYLPWLVMVALTGIAVRHVRPYAESFHDGTRLAAIESVGLRGTLSIDESPFAQKMPPFPAPTPYPRTNPYLTSGTLDKYIVNGHFYSHHPPLSLIAFGGLYRGWLTLGGPDPKIDPESFVRWLTVLHSVVPFSLSLVLMWAVIRRNVSSGWDQALLLLLIGGSTMALTYTQHVNAHMLLLPLFAAIPWLMGTTSRWQALGLGACLGAIYTLDAALGPATAISLGLWWLWKRDWRTLLLACIAALPWVLAHHAVIYHLTGAFGSPAVNPKFWDYEGSIFDEKSLTGSGFKHNTLGTLTYAWDLLFAGQGFLIHNPIMLVAVVVGLITACVHKPERTWLLWLIGWWVMCQVPYVLLSDNFSGVCLSIRWFLPLLAIAAPLLAISLNRFPGLRWPLLAALPLGLYLGYEEMNLGTWNFTELPILRTLATITWLLIPMLWLSIEAVRWIRSPGK
ncbi:MAG: hypothetical protein ACRC8S_10130 [Fimbriiglobus sp.]